MKPKMRWTTKVLKRAMPCRKKWAKTWKRKATPATAQNARVTSGRATSFWRKVIRRLLKAVRRTTYTYRWHEMAETLLTVSDEEFAMDRHCTRTMVFGRWPSVLLLGSSH